ncbi:extracellular calcium-sensing receptor-like [Latimeria chalumnae]|nr:PREDICTED: extracellular calcium-sensing receptor-like [Latimeria chalumnae]|eukprot:XP_014353604.1 PREDICTED: extracellular calcium-sensing receptor-like [Latimeria chalumnae]
MYSHLRSILLIIIAQSAQGSGEPVCRSLGNFELSGLLQEGDIIIGGLFPMHYRVVVPDLGYMHKPRASGCYGFDFRSFRWAQVMRYAIKEINEDPSFLSNITLGYKIYDSCATHVAALRATFTILGNPEDTLSNITCTGTHSVLAFIGDSGSSQSIVVAKVLGPFSIPMISYFSTCACLGDKQEFPTFFRTIPSDMFQIKAIAQLVKHFGWTWIAAVSEDDDYGRYGIQALTEEVEKNGICVAYYEIIPKVYNRQRILEIVKKIKNSSAKIVVAFSGEGELYPLLEEVVHQNITGIQWIASEAWITAALFSPPKYYRFLGGTIGFAVRRGDIPGLKNFLLTVHPSSFPNNSLVKEFWETMFDCTLGTSHSIEQSIKCTGEKTLEGKNNLYTDITQLRISYNVYKGVYAIAHSLKNLINCKQNKGPFINKTCADITQLEPWQLQHYVQEVSFVNSMREEVNFDENGDPIASYDIINWQRSKDGSIQFVPVGRFDEAEGVGHELLIDEDAIIWNGEQTKVPESVCSESCAPGTRKGIREGEPVCCFDCLPCADGEISNQTDSVECIKCPEDYWSNQQRFQCIPKEIEYLSFKEPMGIVLTLVALFGVCLTTTVILVFFYYRSTPIVRANNSELSFLILLSLILCFLCSIIFIGQPTTWNCILRYTVFGISFSLCISCILCKTVVVLMAFKVTVPGSSIIKLFGPVQQRAVISACGLIQVIICIVWLTMAPPYAFKNTQYQSGKIILECGVESALAFWSVLGYIGLLACICFLLAFFVRKLPDNFNEAKYITFSMLIFSAVWIAFIPAYVSSPGKYTVAVQIFAILSSSFSLLTCIFFPKCYIILLKSENNSKQFLMGRK